MLSLKQILQLLILIFYISFNLLNKFPIVCVLVLSNIVFSNIFENKLLNGVISILSVLKFLIIILGVVSILRLKTFAYSLPLTSSISIFLIFVSKASAIVSLSPS